MCDSCAANYYYDNKTNGCARCDCNQDGVVNSGGCGQVGFFGRFVFETLKYLKQIDDTNSTYSISAIIFAAHKIY